MRRQRFLPRACLGICALCLAVVVAAPSPAQDRSVQERLDRIERDLSMLQRQVYHGYIGAPVISGGGGGPDAVNAEIRMERLEAEMRDLTGRVEDMQNDVQRLRQRIEQVNGDIAARFGEAAGPAAGPPMPPPREPAGVPPESPSAEAEATPPGGPAAPGAPVPPPEDGPLFHTMPSPGAARMPAPRTAIASPPAAGTLPDGSALEQYNYAFGLLKQADYADAETALREFVRRHPQDALAGNAQYWLGETYYARGRYAEAASAFAEGYKRFPKGSKAPDDLLKLGMALARANQRQNACLAFGQLEHDFPHPGAAIKERASAERKRLGC